ncbi:SprT-like family protein [Prochlorococcus marinus str. MIT 1313]|nr:SprT-like domain-containing protein [Prochlorococcus marinus]KZR72703.1 SprT-like family protein [Prochlorococcus marinus str. MIT 1313]
MTYFKQPALPAGKARLSDLTKLRDVAAIGCSDPDLALRQTQVYDWFEQWNERFFSNRLRPVHLNVALTSYGATLGLCHCAPVQYIEIHPQCWKSRIGKTIILVSPNKAIGNTEMPSAAWVVLHEMIHLAEAQTNGDINGDAHATPLWVAWCNFIAEQLELPLSYAEMKRGKTKADSDGYRANVWKPRRGMEPVIREGTRLASYDETRCFPFSETDVLMQENKEVRKIKGEEVERLPSF